MDSTNTNATQDGVLWETAYSDLQDALDAAEDGSIIWVKTGTYFVCPNETPGDCLNEDDSTFQLKDQVQLFGGLVGTENEPEDRQPLAHIDATILDGAIPNSSSRANHVVTAIGLSEFNTRIDGFTITNGLATKGTNQSAGAGGGMLSRDSLAPIINCRFVENEAGTPPGFLDIEGLGGGLAIYQTNLPPPEGEPLDLPLVIDCVFRTNTCYSHNFSGSGGAMWVSSMAEPLIVNCLFENNTAEVGTSNSTYGGAISVAGHPRFVNCTIADNTAEGAGQGGGIMVFTTGSLFLTNSIVWGNHAAAGEMQIATAYDPIPPPTGLVVVTYSDVEGGIWPDPGMTNISDPPNFGLDYRLSAGSPAIDAAMLNDTDIPSDVHDIDNDGNQTEKLPDLDFGVRIFGETDPPLLDMGAYEYRACPADIDGNYVVDFQDLLMVLNAWGPCIDCPEDVDEDGDVDFQDLLLLLFGWGPCANPGTTTAPQSVQDCISRYGFDPERLGPCIEAMILAGTP